MNPHPCLKCTKGRLFFEWAKITREYSDVCINCGFTVYHNKSDPLPYTRGGGAYNRPVSREKDRKKRQKYKMKLSPTPS
jgi:hypothetical protein